MAQPISFYSITLADNTVKQNGEPETTTMVVPCTTLTPANVAAQVTLGGNLRVALAAVVLGNFLKNETTYARTITGNGPAATTAAQRENKWLFRYHDAVTYQKFQVSIGTADLAQLPNNSEFLDLDDAGDGEALKTAFEAFVVSPADPTHATILDTVQFVGRNT